MNPLTVRWYRAAEDQLAEIWLGAADKKAVTESVAAIELELQHRGDNRAVSYGLSALDQAEVERLIEQVRVLPEDLRRIALGMLEVIFVVREPDRMVLVYFVRRAR